MNSSQPRLESSGAADTGDAPLETLSVVLVRPAGDQASKTSALLRMAFPGSVVTACPTGAETIARAATGMPVGVCCFDLADGAAGALASHVKQVARACPDAELVVLIEAADRAVAADILEITPSPERLTFLIQPLDMQDAVKSLRAVSARYRARRHAEAAIESRDPPAGLIPRQRRLRAAAGTAMSLPARP